MVSEVAFGLALLTFVAGVTVLALFLDRIAAAIYDVVEELRIANEVRADAEPVLDVALAEPLPSYVGRDDPLLRRGPVAPGRAWSEALLTPDPERPSEPLPRLRPVDPS